MVDDIITPRYILDGIAEQDRGRGLRVEGPAGDRDAHFASFASATYAELVAQLLAVTGDATAARRGADEALAWAGRSWDELTRFPDAQLRTRWTAMLAAAQGPPVSGLGIMPDTGNPEDAVVVEALQLLPLVQRRALVLHYMAGVTVEELATITRLPEDQVDDDLDEALTMLAETIVWADDARPGGDDGTDPRLEWTADVLADTASRLVATVGAPAGSDPVPAQRDGVSPPVG